VEKAQTYVEEFQTQLVQIELQLSRNQAIVTLITANTEGAD